MGGVRLKGLTHRLMNSSLARLLSSGSLCGGPGSGIAADCTRGSSTHVSMKQRDSSGA